MNTCMDHRLATNLVIPHGCSPRRCFITQADTRRAQVPWSCPHTVMHGTHLSRQQPAACTTCRALLCPCPLQDMLLIIVTRRDGFNYTDEGVPGKPKKGFVAWSPGSVLEFKVDTVRSGDAGGQPGADPVEVSIAFLTSYTHMGKARISCVSGCTCTTKDVDAHRVGQKAVSQLELAKVQATQARECVVRVEVQKETQSGQNKFKVAGVIVAEKPAGSVQYKLQEGGWPAREQAEVERQMVYRKGDKGARRAW